MIPRFTDATSISNQYLPLGDLGTDVLEGTESGQPVRIERSRGSGTKTFPVSGDSVDTVIVQDRRSANGDIDQVTSRYYAQSDDGAVRYLGQTVQLYRNGQPVGSEDAWAYGSDTDEPGIAMPAHPYVGEKFVVENVPGVTAKTGAVLSVRETVTVPAGTFSGCLKVKEVTPSEVYLKYYAPGVGLVKEVLPSGQLHLVSHTR